MSLFQREGCRKLLKIDNGTVDVYVIGLQEVSSRLDDVVMDIFIHGEHPWINAIRNTLSNYDYVKIKSIRYFGTVITVFCLRRHMLYLRNIESQHTSLIPDWKSYGKCFISNLLGTKLGNWPRAGKGAVSVRFDLYSKSFCVVCSHLVNTLWLTSHD